MDIYCPKCGEPWDTYHIQHDETEENRKLFMSGKGCPACGFGTICKYCNGTGKDRDMANANCNTCFGFGTFSGFKMISVRGGEHCEYDFDKWYIPYRGNPCPPVPENAKFIRITEKTVESKEGFANFAMFECPECFEGLPVCIDCNGTGKYQKEWANQEVCVRAEASMSLSDNLDDMAADQDW